MNRTIFKLVLPFLGLLAAIQTVAQDTAITNTIGMELLLIKPGSFVMGKFEPPYPVSPDTPDAAAKPNGERGYNAAEFALAKKLATQDAQPGFTATIHKPFYIGKF